MVKVSVITGYYNRGEFLRPTIEAIANQTFDDFEFILFDDASTDDTAARLHAIAEEFADPRFRFIVHEKNTGFTRGMIAAVAQAKGEYIAVQGSADVSLPERLERQTALLDARKDVGAVGCWYTNVVYDTGVRRLRRPNADEATFESLLKGNVFSHGEVMFRRDIYDQVGGYNPAFKFCQDYNLWLRMIKISRLATVPQPLYERYVRNDGVSYAPEKFAVQARYFLLAQRIAQMDEKQAENTLKHLEKNGPLDLIPKSDPALQKRYMMAALRSSIWGNTNAAINLARDNIENPIWRYGVIALAGLYALPISAPIRGLVLKTLGIKLGSPIPDNLNAVPHS